MRSHPYSPSHRPARACARPARPHLGAALLLALGLVAACSRQEATAPAMGKIASPAEEADICSDGDKPNLICGKIQTTGGQLWWAPGGGNVSGAGVALLDTTVKAEPAPPATFLLQFQPGSTVFTLTTPDHLQYLVATGGGGIGDKSQPVRTDSDQSTDGTRQFAIEQAGDPIKNADGSYSVPVRLHTHHRQYLVTYASPAAPDLSKLPIAQCSQASCTQGTSSFTWKANPCEGDDCKKKGDDRGAVTHNHPNSLDCLTVTGATTCPATLAKTSEQR